MRAPRHARQTRMKRRIQRAVASRRAFLYLAAATGLLALATGVLARWLAKEDFPTYGDGVWWAVVTLGTVGYGDIVPHTGWGRVLGVVVIVTGVTFISFLTAIVTSMFVANELDDRVPAELAGGQAAEQWQEALARIEQRLEAIDARLEALREPQKP